MSKNSYHTKFGKSLTTQGCIFVVDNYIFLVVLREKEAEMDKKRILIADDEEVVRTLLVEALKVYEYEIDVVENGAEAISQIEKRSYDLIISDYMMPRMNGLELIRRVKSEYSSVPILMVTGNGPVNDLLKSGATACIMKPFNLLEVQNMVKTILDK